MTQEEFKDEVFSLFKEYPSCDELYFDFRLSNKNFIRITTIKYYIVEYVNTYDGYIIENKIIDISKLHDDYETFLDDLIIFKELILPKYL